MKKIFTLLIFQIILLSLHAQDSTGKCNLAGIFCSSPSSLKNPVFTVANRVTRTYYKSVTPAGYQDVHYYLNYCPFGCTIPSGNPATGCDDDTHALYYYVYYPTGAGINYSTCPLPALIMFHSGSYSECSSPDQDGLDNFCKDMASRGFVVFSCSYRVGVLADQSVIPTASQDLGPKDEYVSAQQILAIYRACQDARGAIRSIIKANATETMFKINTDDIFIGGFSAGSLIAMNAVYYQSQDTHQAMIDAVFPNVSTALGSINPDFYAAPPPTLPSDDFLPSIKGVLNMWGSMFIPKANFSNPYNFFANDKYKPPIISFAGVQDQVFDIHNQPIYFSKNNVSQMLQICGAGPTYIQNFGVETNCLLTSSYTTVQNRQGTRTDEYGIGSETIFHMFDDNSVFTELYLDCQMMHGLDKCDCDPSDYNKDNMHNCTVFCNYQSDFGTGYTNQEDTYNYIAGRAATFFQAIITSTTGVVVNKKFVEQINNRYGCGSPDNPATFVPNTCDGDTHQ